MPMKVAVIAVAAACTFGCASSRQSSGEASEVNGTVQLTVINEYLGTITAYTIWGPARNRIGEVAQGRTRIFETSVRGNRMAVGVQANAAPPPSTGQAGSTSGTGALGGSPTGAGASEAFDVEDGDAFEIRINAAGAIMYRRLEAGL